MVKSKVDHSFYEYQNEDRYKMKIIVNFKGLVN